MTLMTLDQAIANQLEVIAERERRRELEQLEAERQIELARVAFAHAFVERIGEEFILALDTDLVLASVRYEGYLAFRFEMTVSPSGENADNTTEAGVRARRALTLEEMSRPLTTDFVAYRGNSEKWDGWHETPNFIEAVTFAKTGKA